MDKKIIGWVGNLLTPDFKWCYEGEKKPKISSSENEGYKSTGNYVKKGYITGKKPPYKPRKPKDGNI